MRCGSLIELHSGKRKGQKGSVHRPAEQALVCLIKQVMATSDVAEQEEEDELGRSGEQEEKILLAHVI